MYEAFDQKELVTKHEYRLILKYFNNLLVRAMLDGQAFKLPYGIGVFGVSSAERRESNRKPFDYQHYKETGEQRFLTNLHSASRILKVVLRPKPNPLYFDMDVRCMYRFKPNRLLSRGIAKELKNGQSVYKYHSYETYFY